MHSWHELSGCTVPDGRQVSWITQENALISKTHIPSSPHESAVQARVSLHSPQLSPHPSSPHSLPLHAGTQRHLPSPLHSSGGTQVPQVPQHPSLPHSLSLQFGAQHSRGRPPTWACPNGSDCLHRSMNAALELLVRLKELQLLIRVDRFDGDNLFGHFPGLDLQASGNEDGICQT